mmetsp:Transcript_20122/g.27647  ORF Transcript_20122/g.27647 Transcript_20122/m.27647 type:complete len:205 (+) Transcript_20122:38-652(+)
MTTLAEDIKALMDLGHDLGSATELAVADRKRTAQVEKNDVHFSAVGTCRVLLESSMKNYVCDHNLYSNLKKAKCKVKLSKTLNVSEALDHMLECPGKLESWKFFSKNSKLLTSAPGRELYNHLSNYIHNEMGAKENKVSVPEWLEPIEKRFLLRLFKAKGYIVNVIDLVGNIRAPVEDEWNSSPDSTPEPSPLKVSKRGKKRKR